MNVEKDYPTIKLKMAGVLLVPEVHKDLKKKFTARFRGLFEACSKLELRERELFYSTIRALSLGAHAKIAESEKDKKELYKLKNETFIYIANNIKNKDFIKLSYFKSKKFFVDKYCPSCVTKNENQSPKKSCKKCKIDKNFFDILVMTITSEVYSCNLHLSFDQLSKIKDKNFSKIKSLDDYKECLSYKHFRFYPKIVQNLNLEDIIKLKNDRRLPKRRIIKR